MNPRITNQEKRTNLQAGSINCLTKLEMQREIISTSITRSRTYVGTRLIRNLYNPHYMNDHLHSLPTELSIKHHALHERARYSKISCLPRRTEEEPKEYKTKEEIVGGRTRRGHARKGKERRERNDRRNENKERSMVRVCNRLKRREGTERESEKRRKRDQERRGTR